MFQRCVLPLIVRAMKKPHAKESSGSIEVGRTSGDDEARKEREQASLWLKGEGHFLYFQLIFCTRLIHRPDDEAACTSETSVYFNETTGSYIPQSCHLHTRRRENLKSCSD
jgi:hypothetical protein